jgi:1-acyl-sn-glycerol-3-phosphate acyltransferase
MPPGTIKLKPGKIKIFVGEEIRTEGLTVKEVVALKEKTFSQMQSMIVDNAF